MSHYDYEVAKQMWVDDVPFHALIMAAMLKADPHNRTLLDAVFPDVRTELDARYNAPGGVLPDDSAPRTLIVERADPSKPMRPTCSQCGKAWSEPACGPSHAIIAANPKLHWPTDRAKGND